MKTYTGVRQQYPFLVALRQEQAVRPQAAQGGRLGNAVTVEDLQALTPLISGHVRPYGHFRLDRLTRLDIEPPLDTRDAGDTVPMAQGTRTSLSVRRSRRATAQPLALCSLDALPARRVYGW
jgi:hypothetical protein